MYRTLVLAAALAPAVTLAQTGQRLSGDDRADIDALVSTYLGVLGACDAEGFADLFADDGGYFASGFRGRVVGRDRLIAMVESERHCRVAPGEEPAARPGSSTPPEVRLDIRDDGVFGIVELGDIGRYEDEYVRTPDGWKFGARTVLITPELEAGLSAAAMAEIQDLSAALPLGNRYGADDFGSNRFLSYGTVIRVEDGAVAGRVYLEDGSYYEDTYEQMASGTWQIARRALQEE